MQDWNATTFYLVPPTDTEKWIFSRPHHTLLAIGRVVDAAGNATDVPVMGEKSVVLDKNIQKIEMGKYKRKVCEQEKQWQRCQEHKKLLIAAIWGQLDDDTQAKMELLADYQTHWDNGSEQIESYLEQC